MAQRFHRPFAIALAASTLLFVAGCRVTTQENGQNDNVDIATPFGSMQVKTNDNVKNDRVGLAVYPGSIQEKSDSDNSAADINMNFGDFHLGVQAMSYKTKDGQDKVISFYRKDMSRYGAVIECRGNHIVGKPERTGEGLGCDNDKTKSTTDGDLQLRAGSPHHQHIVSIEDHDGGTRFGLIAITLPTEMNRHTEKESE